jgi:hypothetical protein
VLNETLAFSTLSYTSQASNIGVSKRAYTHDVRYLPEPTFHRVAVTKASFKGYPAGRTYNSVYAVLGVLTSALEFGKYKVGHEVPPQLGD